MLKVSCAVSSVTQNLGLKHLIFMCKETTMQCLPDPRSHLSLTHCPMTKSITYWNFTPSSSRASIGTRRPIRRASFTIN